MERLQVLFRVFPEGDTIALFPNDICDFHGIGQHSAASPCLVNELKPASDEQASILLNELVYSIGYTNLEVLL